MTGDVLRELFGELAKNSSVGTGESFSALTIPGVSGHMVALSSSGKPGLLIRTIDGGVTPPRIHLAGLKASFGVPCRFSVDGAPAEERCISIIECTAPDEVRSIFADFGGTFLRLLGPRPTMAQTASAVARFAAIFASLTRPSRQSITGLIGELMLLVLSPNTSAAVNSWRSTDFDHFDFVSPDARVECKATSSGVRVHSLSWNQCTPPDGPALVASLFVERAGGGTSVQELIDRIEARMIDTPDAAIRLRETISATMGASLQQALLVRFDEAACRSSLQWFDLRTVPAIRGELPHGVGALRFNSDFRMCDHVTTASLLGTGLAALAF